MPWGTIQARANIAATAGNSKTPLPDRIPRKANTRSTAHIKQNPNEIPESLIDYYSSRRDVSETLALQGRRSTPRWRLIALIVRCITCMDCTAVTRSSSPQFGEAVNWKRARNELHARPDQN